MLRNQLALTEGVRANQRAITQGFNQLERLADIREMPGLEQEPSTSQSGTEQSKKTQQHMTLKKKINNQDRQVLQNLDYPRPNNFFNTNPTRLQEIYNEVTNDKKAMGNKIGALKRTKNKTEAEKEELDLYTIQHGVLSKYRNVLQLYLNSLDLQVGEGRAQRGQGIKNPNQLIDRLKLLGGRIMAGNNGVVPEFTQIANYLNLIKVLPTKELNKMMKKMKIYLGIS